MMDAGLRHMSPAKCEDPLLAILLQVPGDRVKDSAEWRLAFAWLENVGTSFFCLGTFLILPIKIQMAMAGWLHHDVIA